MLTARDIATIYVSFFEKRKHVQIPNAPLAPDNDPTTLFISSGMQPLVPYLLGETHPAGTRLVNVQNCFRAVDIDEIGDNRHTTFFRMLGNWSLGNYFKKEEISWFWEFLTKELKLSPKKLYITVFKGIGDIPRDEEAVSIWTEILKKDDLHPQERIFYYSDKSNWWSRSGTPDKMPSGEPGGPSTEVFFEFDIAHNPKFGKECHPNCDCGRFMEIGNSVFMEYVKQENGTFKPLPQKNIDFGGGLERLLSAVENKQDMFQTNLLRPIIKTIEIQTAKNYNDHAKEMRIIADHFIASSFIILAGVKPSNKDQGYILRRLIRRGLDNLYQLKEVEISPILEAIATQYGDTDPILKEKYEEVKNTILEEETGYKQTRETAKRFIQKRYPAVIPVKTGIQDKTGSRVEPGMTKNVGDELTGSKEISPEDAFLLYATHGLSPTQIKSLGFTFDEKMFAQKMEEHQALSRAGAAQKFAGGLADHQEKTIMGHTATHLLHQAIRDIVGSHVHQTGSNITTERLRFDFNHDRKLTDEEIKQVEDIVNNKIREDLPVRFEMMPLKRAKEIGAIGLFDDKYQENVKIYFIGPSTRTPAGVACSGRSFSIEFCGGPHVEHTGILEKFSIIKQENIGHGQRRIYAVVGNESRSMN